MICPNGRDGDCMSKGTVYLISCKACDGNYIGETGRPLCVRIKEHLAGKRRSALNTPLGSHRVQAHNGNDFEVEVTILAQEQNTSARKIVEAFWINSMNPTMNRREECLTITRDMQQYIRLFL